MFVITTCNVARIHFIILYIFLFLTKHIYIHTHEYSIYVNIL